MVALFLIFRGTGILFPLAAAHFAVPPVAHKGSSFITSTCAYLFRLWLVCLCWVFVPARAFFPLVVASRGYSLVAVSGLLFAVASVAVEHGLWGAQASVVAAPGF